MNNKEFQFINRTEIIDKINHFSGRNESFIFGIDFHGEKGFVLTPQEADLLGLQYDIRGVKNTEKTSEKSSLKFDLIPIDFKTYIKAFEKVVYHLKRGDTYLLNLTFPTSIVSDHSLSEIYAISSAPYKLFLPGHFIIFSPESFVRIEKSLIYSCPMKGTIDAAIPHAAQKLLANEKEVFEHNTIVDLIRNDLSMVSTNICVSRSRFLDHIHTNRGDLLQMSSEIVGELPPDFRSRLGEILFTLLPAGSVTGAPKEKTVAIIRETESYDRGFYTGIFGLFDSQNLHSAVSIRFIEQTAGGMVFKSGGGITALSDATFEYDEMLKKVYVPVV